MTRRIRALACAAAILVAAGLIVFSLLSRSKPADVARRQAGPAKEAFRLTDGTLVYPKGESKYTVVGDRHLRLEDGQILLFVARSGKPFVVDTPEATAEAHGTTFTIATGQAATFVAVGQGLIDVRNRVGSVKLRPGQQAWVPKAGRPRRGPAPRFSHLVNWARRHLQGKDLFQSDQPHASGELVAVDPRGQKVRLELRRYHIDVVIEDGVARTTVDQTFFNQLTWQIEGTFYFPLPPDASLSRLAMYVNGELNEGGMVERQYGRHVYESIVYRRRDPALLEMMEGNVFKMRVFPIFGRKEKRVILSYTQTLGELYKTLRYWFPMEHANDRARELSIRVRVKNGAGKAKAASSTHKIDTRTDGDDLVIRHTAHNVAPNQDFLLHLSPQGEEDWSAPVASFQQGDRRFLFVRCRPQIDAPVETRPRQWFLLNDVSASRTSVDVKAQAYIIERLLAEADDGDTFALVNLDTRAHVWRRDLMGVRDRVGADAVAFADAPQRLGATNIAAGLKAVSKLIDDNGADNAHVVYLGDGVATDETTVTKYLLWACPKKAVFLGLGVGKKVDARFLQAAADATGGLFATINPSEDIRWRVFDLVAALNTPRLVDVKASFADANGGAVALEAYPSTGTLCEGEVLTVLARTDKPLPARMVLTGRVGATKFRKEYALAAADAKAAYAPRLWASARINHLLRDSAAEHKSEIIQLSKASYVVTPFTSLIVLENEADYKKWKVEMGRTDHWQLYPAPKKIDVVHEPLKHQPWVGRPAPLKGKPGHPKTIEEIVDSVQFRVGVGLYGYYPHQRRQRERFRLQALLSGRLMVAGLGTIARLPAACFGKGDQQSGTSGGGSFVPFDGENGKLRAIVATLPGGTSGWLRLSHIRRIDELDALGGRLEREGLAPMLSTGLIPEQGFLALPGAMLLDRQGKGKGHRPSLAGLETHSSLSGYLPALLSGGSLRSDWSVGHGLEGNSYLATNEELNGRYVRWRLQPVSGLPGSLAGSPRGDLKPLGELPIGEREKQQFGRAWVTRQQRDRDRIRQFNRRYSGWNYDGYAYDSNRLLNAGSALAGAYEPFLRIARQQGLGQAAGASEDLSKDLDRLRIGQAGRSSEAGFTRYGYLPPIFLRSYARTLGAVPGTLATLAVDRLLPLRPKLRALKPGAKRDKAIAALDALLKRLGELSAATESTGIFWSRQGWQVQPARWDFQQPQWQAWPGSRGMVDLTRYAPGLASTWSDVADLVLAAFGKAPPGKVDAEAAKRIAAARRNTPTMRIRYTDKKGDCRFALWAGRGDRFAWTRRSSMYLREDFVCDGKAWYHVYPELGLAARRVAATRRLAALRQLAPHLLPPARELARAFDVKLVKVDGPLTTLRLTPAAPGPKKPKADKPTEAAKLAVLVTFDDRGFLHRQVWQVDSQDKLTCTVAYKDSRVEGTWTAGDKTLAEFSYQCEAKDPAADPFTPQLEDIVVLDMPLRRAEHYQALLKEIETDADKLDERMRLRRHLALAQIQDYNWQAPWGRVNAAYQTVLAGLQERAKAGQKEVLVGDMALVGSAGYAPSIRGQREKLDLPLEHTLVKYWLNHGNSARMKELAEADRGGFVGHFAAYHVVYHGGSERVAATRELMKTYPDSPLLYAAALYCGSNEDIWLELAKQPRWRLMALFTAAQRKPTAKVAEAFEALHKEWTEKGWEMPISSRMVAALKVQDPRWQRVVKRSLALAVKSKDVGALLRFAELAWTNNEKELASVAVDKARGQVAEKLPLTWKLAWAQSLWAMGRTQEAWQHYEQITAALKKAGLKPSPALLATMARLAQHTNRPEPAVELELRAIEAEQPHMPQRINVRFFRQRYQWLWGQLIRRIQQCAAAVKAKPEDAAAKGALEEALARAAKVWWTWRPIDTGNHVYLHRQLATAYRTAGDTAGAWRAVSSLIDEKPKDGSSYYQVGQWYVTHGERDAGQQWYGRAYEVEPTNGDWIWNRAELLRQMGRTGEARVLYEEIAQKKWQPRFQHYTRKANDRLKKL